MTTITEIAKANGLETVTDCANQVWDNCEAVGKTRPTSLPENYPIIAMGIGIGRECGMTNAEISAEFGISEPTLFEVQSTGSEKKLKSGRVIKKPGSVKLSDTAKRVSQVCSDLSASLGVDFPSPIKSEKKRGRKPIPVAEVNKEIAVYLASLKKPANETKAASKKAGK